MVRIEVRAGALAEARGQRAVTDPMQGRAPKRTSKASECASSDARCARPKSSVELRKKLLVRYSVMHFGASFDRPAHERDYLWGSLDGDRHLIGLLLGAAHTHEEGDDGVESIRRHR
jgi:hypothetical protein